MPARERVLDLVGRVERGDFLGAFEEFYADDVEMRGNLAPPTIGKEANRERERAFVASGQGKPPPDQPSARVSWTGTLCCFERYARGSWSSAPGGRTSHHGPRSRRMRST